MGVSHLGDLSAELRHHSGSGPFAKTLYNLANAGWIVVVEPQLVDNVGRCHGRRPTIKPPTPLRNLAE